MRYTKENFDALSEKAALVPKLEEQILSLQGLLAEITAQLVLEQRKNDSRASNSKGTDSGRKSGGSETPARKGRPPKVQQT
jgi:hypothetical protein